MANKKGKKDFFGKSRGPTDGQREKSHLARTQRKLLWNGKPNPEYKAINLRLPPEKR